MTEWEPDLDVTAPPWLVPGARVAHSSFGSGTVGRVATYKSVPTVWIDFDSGQTKALALEFGLTYLSPLPQAAGMQRRGFLRRTGL